MKLEPILDALEAMHGPPPEPLARDPFAVVLLENVAYLVPDARRAELFLELKKKVGLTPQKVLAAPTKTLVDIAKRGGMHPEKRVDRLREAAELALELDLRAALDLPFAKARAVFKKLPGVGEPGAEKILLLARKAPVLALESNGVRVLTRLGVGEEKKSYAPTYRSVQSAAKLPADVDALWRARELLRMHGQAVCKTSRPLCEACPVARDCGRIGVSGAKA